jgi:16S rRNA (guanine527-N7)-methyltransferase
MSGRGASMPPSAGDSPEVAGDGPEVFGGLDVSRETIADLTLYADLLARWQNAKNLIAPGEFPHLWRRHFLDSYQLHLLFPGARHWLDLGSGAGFPGLVTAIALKRAGGHVTLVESNHRKAAFLREAARQLQIPVTVRAERVDSVVKQWAEPLDMISARAFAPFGELCAHLHPLINRGARAALLKGRDFWSELKEASLSWAIDLVEHPSMVAADSVIVEVRGLEPRIGAAR